MILVFTCLCLAGSMRRVDSTDTSQTLESQSWRPDTHQVTPYLDRRTPAPISQTKALTIRSRNNTIQGHVTFQEFAIALIPSNKHVKLLAKVCNEIHTAMHDAAKTAVDTIPGPVMIAFHYGAITVTIGCADRVLGRKRLLDYAALLIEHSCLCMWPLTYHLVYVLFEGAAIWCTQRSTRC